MPQAYRIPWGFFSIVKATDSLKLISALFFIIEMTCSGRIILHRFHRCKKLAALPAPDSARDDSINGVWKQFDFDDSMILRTK